MCVNVIWGRGLCLNYPALMFNVLFIECKYWSFKMNVYFLWCICKVFIAKKTKCLSLKHNHLWIACVLHGVCVPLWAFLMPECVPDLQLTTLNDQLDMVVSYYETKRESLRESLRRWSALVPSLYFGHNNLWTFSTSLCSATCSVHMTNTWHTTTMWQSKCLSFVLH